MEERVAAPVDGVDAAAQIVPVADFVHRLVADDLFEDVRRRRPIYPAQHEKPPVEPRRQADARRRGRARRGPCGRSSARSRSARIATSSLVPPGARFRRRISSCRRGSEAKCRSLASSSVGCARQALDRLRQLLAVRAEVAGQRLEERQPARRRRDSGSGRAPRAPSRCRRLRPGLTAAPRTARPVRPPSCFASAGSAAAKQRAAALGNRGQEGRRKRRCCSCRAGSNPVSAESYMGFRAKPITIKRA